MAVFDLLQKEALAWARVTAVVSRLLNSWAKLEPTC